MFRKLVVMLVSLFIGTSVFAVDLDDVAKENLETIKNSKNIAIEIMRAKGYEDFSLNEKSLKILDDLISEEGATYSENLKDKLTQILGSYLGELIIQEHGGKWGKFDGSYAVKTNSEMVSFPFQKVYKHISNGSEDSIYSFYVISGLSSDDIEQLEKNTELEFKPNRFILFMLYHGLSSDDIEQSRKNTELEFKPNQ